MSFFKKLKRDPLKAPWPPGLYCRMVNSDKLGRVIQLRPGSLTPPALYLEMLFQNGRRNPN